MIGTASTDNLQGPRSVSEIKTQLSELTEVRRIAEAYGARDFASQIGLESIKKHEQSLRAELQAAEMLESGSDVELVFQTTEEEITLTGTLVGGNIEAPRFELKVGDETIQGRASDAVKSQLKQITFGAQVEAQLRVTTLAHEVETVEPKITYFLVSIKQEDDSESSGHDPHIH